MPWTSAPIPGVSGEIFMGGPRLRRVVAGSYGAETAMRRCAGQLQERFALRFDRQTGGSNHLYGNWWIPAFAGMTKTTPHLTHGRSLDARKRESTRALFVPVASDAPAGVKRLRLVAGASATADAQPSWAEMRATLGTTMRTAIATRRSRVSSRNSTFPRSRVNSGAQARIGATTTRRPASRA